MTQSGQLSAAERTKLITLLPRLRRFATVLAGNRSGADALLRTSCKKMLRSGEAYQRGMAFDIWAFRALHGDWLAGLRSHETPLAQPKADPDAFTPEALGEEGDGRHGETAEILSQLPAQQRGAVLLVYGEGFSYEEAGEVLDTTAETVIARVSRALASFIERADWLDSVRLDGADVQQLKQINRQAG